MGQPLRFKKVSSLMPRILSALFLIPLCLYMIYVGSPYSLILGGGVTTGVFIEWARLLLKCTLPPLQKSLYSFIGTLYISIAAFWFLWQMGVREGWGLIYWLFFLVWSTDTAAFLGGKILRGPKLAPSISPKKTWSGFLIGMLGGVGVGYETSFWLFPGVFTFWGIVLLVFIAQLGDLLESQAKRWSQVKDSSSLIPGHGGLLDRVDSLIAISFALALWEMIH